MLDCNTTYGRHNIDLSENIRALTNSVEIDFWGRVLGWEVMGRIKNFGF